MVAVTASSSLEVAQEVVKSWTDFSCMTGMDRTTTLGNIFLSSPPPIQNRNSSRGSLTSRATCKSIKAANGDSCLSLAKKCGVTLANFQKYNPGKSFCSSLQPNQPVCCSAGTLPTPKPGKDGTCATYTVQSGDWCTKVAAANATTTADFINVNSMDGIDIDWEYPGAPDIPGIPPGNPKDTANYLAFLKLLRTKLSTEKSMYMTATASFWYLKPFPIAEMSKVLDYIVFMTYDLHGQWDYGSTWARPGCLNGSCLRSHINLTETENALSMITKAGVPSNKVLVGVSSYGRSFRMSNPSCTGLTCVFTGPKSGAAKGECTDTAGYIANAEINRIIQNGAPGLKQYTDNSDLDIFVYGNTWVSYMSDKRKENRIKRYKGLNFGGVSDWAVDLENFNPSGGSGGSDDGSEMPYSAMSPFLQGCSEEERKHVNQAWAETGEIAWRHWQWSPGGKWQNAMDVYLGKETRKDYDI
ncbi:hypothetical protein AK830_g9049 [Neonectria ditissima]|uniref:chitinase n=1 Tax=Neonectria ditissima TaxID=78410 RepID=A0A0P7AJ66_9HYPO|nr:hypothetical protein AK830_g9049 [Neonectria ditissima]